MNLRSSPARISAVWPILLAVLILAPVTGCSKKAKAERAARKADTYAKAGELARAEVEYLNALRNDPKSFASNRGLGAVLLEQGRYGAARILLERARVLNPADPVNQHNLVLLTYQTGDREEAQKRAQEMLKNDPKDSLAPIILAETATSPADMAERKAQLEHQAATTPTAALFVAIATLQFRQGNAEAAAASARQAVTLDPKNYHARLVQASLAWTRKDLATAEACFKEAAELAPVRSTEHMALANFKMSSGDLAGARIILEDISKAAPDYIPVLVNLANLAVAQKRFADCAALVEKILTRDPTHPNALLLKGWANLATGDGAKAVVAAQRLVTLFPETPVVHHQLALALLATKEQTKAEESLKRASLLDPTFPEPALVLAGLQTERTEYGAALTTLRTLLKNLPGHFQTRFQIADTLRQKGDFSEALDLLQQLEQDFPTMAQIPWKTGTVLLQQGKFPEARQKLARVLALDPKHKPALDQLVNLDLADKQYAAAANRVAQFRPANPDGEDIELLQAKIHLAQGQTAEAERILLDVLKARPDSRTTLKFLAETYIMTRQGVRAIPHLEKLITLAPRDLQTLNMLGSLQADAGRLAEARAAYEKFLAIETNGVVLNNLASVYTQLGQLDQAEASARKARENLPPAIVGNAADTLGWVLFKKKDYASALPLFQEACTKLPQFADHHFHLGLTHYALGEGELARAPLEKALQIQPDAPWKTEAAQLLAVVKVAGSGKSAEMVAVLSGALEKNPEDVFALKALATAREGSGAYAESAQLLKRALQAQPGNVSVLLALARLHAYKLNSPAEALEYARTSHKLMANDPQVAAVAGQVAYAAGDHLWAALMLRQAARPPEADAKIRLALAEAEYAIGAVAAAKQVLEQINRDPKPNLLREEALRLARLIGLAEDSSLDKAAAAFVNESLQRDPSRLAALTASANLALTEGNPAAAIKQLEAALSLYPNFIPATKVLAGLYVWDFSKQDRARELVTKAAAGAPADPAIEGILGVLNCRQGDFKKAQRQLLAGIAANRNDARLVFYLGLTELGLKNAEEARTHLTRALDMPGLPVPMQVEARDVLDNRLSMLMHEATLAK